MLKVYTDKALIPIPYEERFNEAFFVRHIGLEDLTPLDFDVIGYIDKAVLTSGGFFDTPFGITRMENLSTGCKTIINVLHFPDRAFNLAECGNNAFSKLAEVCYENNLDLCVYMSFYRELNSDTIPILLNDVQVNGADKYYSAWRACELENEANALN